MSVTELKVNLTDLPERMRGLPIDPQRHVPVPWFVKWLEGKPEFRVMDGDKWTRAVREKLCWVCGHRLGAYLAFVIGPMCGITRTTAEPPNHLECARWSARNCPFITRPHMVRRNADQILAMGAKADGFMIARNPGVTLLWITRSYKVWSPARGEYLMTVGDPESVECWAEGRTATRDELDESIRTGLPLLEEQAGEQQGGMEELARQVAEFRKLLPGGVT